MCCLLLVGLVVGVTTPTSTVVGVVLVGLCHQRFILQQQHTQ